MSDYFPAAWPLLAAYAAFLLLLLHITRPVYIALKKRGAGYGIVFDSATNAPVALATVRLLDLHNLPVSSAVTDRKGRYRLAASKGEYYVDVVKTGYQFPSQHFDRRCGAYDNVLPTHHIKVQDYGMITKNIPIDPVAAGTASRLLPRICLSTNVQFLIGYLSPFVVILVPLSSPSFLSWSVYAVYVAITIGRIATFRPSAPAFGTIKDSRTGRPLEKAVVRIFEAKFNKLLETQVTSHRGRYAFVIRPGAYYVLIQKPGFKSIRINFPHIKKEGFVLSRNVTMKPSGAGAVPPEPAPDAGSVTESMASYE
jgi:hypothetical protein